MEEGIDGFVVSSPELFVEGASSDSAGFIHQPESAEFVQALRAAFDGVAADTGKDRALIVRAEDVGNATQSSVFYGSADAAGAHLVLNKRVIEGLKDAGCKAAMGKCLAKGGLVGLKNYRLTLIFSPTLLHSSDLQPLFLLC